MFNYDALPDGKQQSGASNVVDIVYNEQNVVSTKDNLKNW